LRFILRFVVIVGFPQWANLRAATDHRLVRNARFGGVIRSPETPS